MKELIDYINEAKEDSLDKIIDKVISIFYNSVDYDKDYGDTYYKKSKLKIYDNGSSEGHDIPELDKCYKQIIRLFNKFPEHGKSININGKTRKIDEDISIADGNAYIMLAKEQFVSLLFFENGDVYQKTIYDDVMTNFRFTVGNSRINTYHYGKEGRLRNLSNRKLKNIPVDINKIKEGFTNKELAAKNNKF